MRYELNEDSPKYKEAKHIIFIVSKALSIPMKKLLSNSRKRQIVDIRRICYVILKQKMDLPAVIIGSYFNKDHANILHHLNSHEILYKTDFDYRICFDKAIKRLENNEYVENDMYECINNMLNRIESLEKHFKKLENYGT